MLWGHIEQRKMLREGTTQYTELGYAWSPYLRKEEWEGESQELRQANQPGSVSHTVIGDNTMIAEGAPVTWSQLPPLSKFQLLKFQEVCEQFVKYTNYKKLIISTYK